MPAVTASGTNFSCLKDGTSNVTSPHLTEFSSSQPNETTDYFCKLLGIKQIKALYNSIKNEKLEWAVDDEEKKKSPTEGTDEKANGTHPKTISRIGSTTNPFLDIPHDPNAAVYKSGFLARKIHADMDGKKS
ncbi:PH and SEC7 domain-containing protein 3 [Tupaia chinensis]|uniref:PH and SEC7 domain-containing protein 3 n=1 Tax=Tupaia chinensis TaxID=246437 RepID=L8YAZ9_TUPCH|nr:PH and SEC7 domain-containing protein 3 [Tupaia chinensis]